MYNYESENPLIKSEIRISEPKMKALLNTLLKDGDGSRFTIDGILNAMGFYISEEGLIELMRENIRDICHVNGFVIKDLSDERIRRDFGKWLTYDLVEYKGYYSCKCKEIADDVRLF